jgi:hypothetical protein
MHFNQTGAADTVTTPAIKFTASTTRSAMNTINKDFAVEALWAALGWEQIKPGELFDAIAHRLRRHPSLCHLGIAEIDLMLADARREFEHDIDEYRWRLVASFKSEIEFYEEGHGMRPSPIDQMRVDETENGWIVVEDKQQIAGPFLSSVEAWRWVDSCEEGREQRRRSPEIPE